MSIVKIQKGDNVKVVSGAFKGHTGTVTKVVSKLKRNGTTQKKVSISDVKQLTDYRKSNREYNLPGEMKLKDRLIDISNVSLVDENGKVSKIRVELDKNSKKTRIFKTSGKAVPNKAAKSIEKKDNIVSKKK